MLNVTLNVFWHFALIAFLLAGYVGAYRQARRTQLELRSPPFSRALSGAVCVAAPVVAAIGVYIGWRGPILPQFVGGGINVTLFYGALLRVLSKKHTHPAATPETLGD
jgi:hypothetical protein